MVALGTMTFGDAGTGAAIGGVPVDGARALVDQALEAGVNVIDTADVYSTGRSEEIVGEILEGRRDDVLIATKARFPMGHGPNDAGLSRHYLVRACEASLRRLRTDYIDLYQVHERDGITPVDETLDALDTLVRDGKVRYIGCSNHSAWHLMKALGTSERLGLARYVSQQIYYSLLHREAEYELVPLSVDERVGILVWSPLAGGLLSGKYAPATARPRRAPGIRPTGGNRRSTTRTGCTTSSRRWWRWRGSTGTARHRRPSPTSWASPPSPPWWSAPVRPSSWPTTWRRRPGPSTRRPASASTM